MGKDEEEMKWLVMTIVCLTIGSALFYAALRLRRRAIDAEADSREESLCETLMTFCVFAAALSALTTIVFFFVFILNIAGVIK